MADTESSPLRIAAVGDIHYSRHSQGRYTDLFIEASSKADVLLLCGDMTDHGTPEEASILAEDLRSHCRVPIIGVLGNHDHESGQETEVIKILERVGVQMLDGDCAEIKGVGFVGVSGFGGGFGSKMLTPWGEPATKDFVQEAVNQALKLERALTQLQSSRRIALLHYSPVVDTVIGEPPEIYAFLGSTRLEGPLNRFDVIAAFHGHAHLGAHEGRTAAGVKIFNVAVPVLQRTHPDRAPIFFFEVPPEASEPQTEAPSVPEDSPNSPSNGEDQSEQAGKDEKGE